MIKSIQMHDDDIKLANCPARVGLSLKGIKPDEVGRVISSLLMNLS